MLNFAELCWIRIGVIINVSIPTHHCWVTLLVCEAAFVCAVGLDELHHRDEVRPPSACLLFGSYGSSLQLLCGSWGRRTGIAMASLTCVLDRYLAVLNKNRHFFSNSIDVGKIWIDWPHDRIAHSTKHPRVTHTHIANPTKNHSISSISTDGE